jgi:DNA-binding NtrC family response regulator
VPCGHLPEFLLDLELFGRSPDGLDFEGVRDPGAFARAAGGTLVLDRVEQASPRIQARLVERLAEKGDRPRRRPEAPARVVATASSRIDELAAQGRFRRELIELFGPGRVDLPALGERGRRHLVRMVRHLEGELQRQGRTRRALSPGALRRLAERAWPGNLPELRSVVEALLVARGTGEVAACEVDALLGAERSLGEPLAADAAERHEVVVDRVRCHVERTYLRRLLARFGGRVDQCAAHSGLSRRTISAKLRKHGIDRCSFRPRAGRGA